MSHGHSPQHNIAKAGIGFLKRLVFEEDTLTADNRRNSDRTPVAGEVSVLLLDEAGNAVGKTRVFVRDLSRTGCGLWSRTRFPEGAHLILHFPANNAQPPIGRHVTVCHCRGQDGAGFAVGCRFLDEPPKAE